MNRPTPNIQKRKLKLISMDICTYFVILCVLVAALIPIWWMITTSLKTRGDIFAMPPKLTFTPTLANYSEIFREKSFLNYLINSILVTLFSTWLALCLGVPAAYGLSRFSFKWKNDLAFWILSIRIAPPIAAAIPLFILISKAGLYNTRTGLVLVYLLFNLPFVVWMVRGFISDIPKELDEAAMIDGCGAFRVLWTIILPLIRPGIMAASVICLIFSWNEFLFSLVLTGIDSRTLPVSVTQFLTLTGVAWGPMSAAGTVIMLPVLIFSITIQKRLVQGLTLGAIK